MTFVAVVLLYGVIAACLDDYSTRTTRVAVTASPPAGPQYYVATSGDDSWPGTMTQPWRTMQKAMSSVPPGSTVNVRGGTYSERLVVRVEGTAGNYITFQPYGFSVPDGGCGGYTGVACGGEQVVLDYSGLGTISDGVPFLLISNKSYVRVQGLTFANYTTYEINGVLNYGVRIDGSSSYVEIKYNRFLNNKDTAPWNGTSAFAHFRVWGPAHDIWVYGNELGNIVSNYSEAMTADGGASNFVAENNWVHDTDGIGIDLHGGAHDYTVRGNRLEYISVRRDGTIWYGNPSIGIYNDGGNTGVIEGNFISESGVGIEALAEPGQPYAHDIVIRDNVVQRSDMGIVIGTWHSTTDGSIVYNLNVFNNTFYANSIAVVIRPMIASTVAWKNNLFANNNLSYVNTLGWPVGIADYNLYFGGGAGPGPHLLASDPLFVNAAAGDFSLAPGSPAKDAGSSRHAVRKR